MIAAATRSLETAVSGGTPKSTVSIGVIRAPPPMPVRPTMTDTSSAPAAIVKSKCICMSYRQTRQLAQRTFQWT